jgi:hypothetical protein
VAENDSITKDSGEPQWLQPDLSDVILDFSSVMFIDTVGASAIQQVMQDYKDIGVRVLIACCRRPVFEQLYKAGVFKKVDQCIVYVTVHDAVLAAVGSHQQLYEKLKRDRAGPLGSVLNVSPFFDASFNNNVNDQKLTNGSTLGQWYNSSHDDEQNISGLESV